MVLCAAPGCSGTSASMRCGGCKQVWYCQKDCQRKHWKQGHSKACRPLTAGRASGGSAAGRPDASAARCSSGATTSDRVQQKHSFSKAMLPPELRQECIYQPSADGKDENILVLLHGLGDTPGPYAALGRKMALPNTATLALAGPIPVAFTDAGRAWFTSFDHDMELIEGRPGEVRREESLRAARRLLERALEGLHTQGGWPYQRIHLFGFSQGGCAALDLSVGYTGLRALGGCAAVSGALLPESLCSEDYIQEMRKRCASGEAVLKCTPVVVTHGNRDDTLDRATVTRTVECLKETLPWTTPAVSLHTFPKGHAMISGKQEMQVLMEFWARTLGAAAPDLPDDEDAQLVEVDPATLTAI